MADKGPVYIVRDVEQGPAEGREMMVGYDQIERALAEAAARSKERGPQVVVFSREGGEVIRHRFEDGKEVEVPT